MTKELEHRLASKLDIRPDQACWNFTGARDKTGYGRIGNGPGKPPLLTHRAAWLVWCGPIPSGLCVCHTCDNRSCCNPAHLFLGTPSDNMLDMVAKKRHGLMRVPREDRELIREAYADGATQVALAWWYGVRPPAIWKIVKGWKPGKSYYVNKTGRHIP